MLTYNRGEWKEDTTLLDEWEFAGEDRLKYPGFETYSFITLGDEFTYQIKVWRELDDNKDPYEYFAMLANEDHTQCVLVVDYPSVLMLIKEVEPIIRLSMDCQKFKMTEEEHMWKAKEMVSNDVITRSDCEHI